MAVWVAEANDPVDWQWHAISPIVYDSGWIVYIGGYNVQKFYKYNLGTDTWTELTDPPGVLYAQLSMSPDETKLAGHIANGTQLFIYDISSPSWTTSATAPNLTGGYTPSIQSTVWADDDTVWCQVRGHNGTNFDVKFFRYVVSTDTWAQFTNKITGTYGNSQNTCINTAGTELFAGQGVAGYRYMVKYIIATDTISQSLVLPSAYYFVAAADRHKLWFGPRRTTPAVHYTITRWVNPDTEVLEGDVFPEKGDAYTQTPLSAGVYGTTVVIAAQKIANPKLWSYIGALAPTVTTDPATDIS